MNTKDKEEVVPTKAHEILSMAFPILTILAALIDYLEPAGHFLSLFFLIVSIVLVWKLPPNQFKLLASVILVGCLITYTPVIIYFIIRISLMFE